MSLDNIYVVDAVSTEAATGIVVLTIADSWSWDNKSEHLKALQEKLNIYFGFVESGEIYESYPSAVGKIIRIDIVCRYNIPNDGIVFLKKASDVAELLNIEITHKVH